MVQEGMSQTGGARTVNVVAGKKIDGSIDLKSGPLSLTLKIEPKPGDTVNLAQAFLFRGHVAARNGDDIMDAFLASGGQKAADGQATLELGGAAGMIFWVPQMGMFPTFKRLFPGTYSACVIPVTGNPSDQTLMARILRNLDKLEVFCKPVTLAATPTIQETTMVVPAMRPLPAEDE
jgi:hypothetical protein